MNRHVIATFGEWVETYCYHIRRNNHPWTSYFSYFRVPRVPGFRLRTILLICVLLSTCLFILNTTGRNKICASCLRHRFHLFSSFARAGAWLPNPGDLIFISHRRHGEWVSGLGHEVIGNCIVSSIREVYGSNMEIYVYIYIYNMVGGLEHVLFSIYWE